MSALDLFTPATREWFERAFRGADAGTGSRLAGDRLRRAHADPGADRLGEDARRLPVRDRPAERGARRGTPAALRLAAEGAELRRRAQPARAAGRPPVGADRRRSHRRHAAEGAGGDAAQAARHPDHHARVAVPAAHLAGPRHARRRPYADPRRGACRRRHQTGRAPRALGRAARSAASASPSSASGCPRRSARSRRSAASSSGARPIRLVDAGTRKELDLRVVVPVEDMREPGAGAVQTDPLLGTGAEGVATTSIWPSIYPALLRLVEEHRSTIVFVNNRRLAERLALRLNELAREARSRAPTTARWPASSGSRSRSCSSAARSRAWWRPRRSSSASTWAQSTW